MEARSFQDPHGPTHRSWYSYLLPVVWIGLGARIVVALVRGESLRDDFLSLALIAFFMTTSLLGSRIWLWFHERRLTFGRRTGARHVPAEGPGPLQPSH